MKMMLKTRLSFVDERNNDPMTWSEPRRLKCQGGKLELRRRWTTSFSMCSSRWSLHFPAEISAVPCDGHRAGLIVALKGTDSSGAATPLPFQVNEANGEELRTVWIQMH